MLVTSTETLKTTEMLSPLVVVLRPLAPFACFVGQYGSADRGEKKNQASMASTQTTTLMMAIRSTTLTPYLPSSDFSRSPLRLRNHGEVRRALCGRPMSLSYASLTRVKSRTSVISTTASTTTTTRIAFMLTPVLGARAPIHPSNREPTHSANTGPPVQIFTLASAPAMASTIRSSLKNRGGVQPVTCSSDTSDRAALPNRAVDYLVGAARSCWRIQERIAREWVMTVPSGSLSAGSFVPPVALRNSSREPLRKKGIGLP
jgi:hypothetical protein